MSELASSDPASEFQSRRRETRRLVRPWAILTAAGFAVFILLFYVPSPFGPLGTLNLLFGGFIAAGVSIIRITFVVRRLYRCPVCDGIPRTRGSVLLDPETCPDCGARLK